jgi:hypothetical protein
MKESSTMDADLIELALQASRDNHERALSQRHAVDAEIEQWKLKIEKLEKLAAEMSSKRNATKHAASSHWRTKSGRARHNLSEQLITRFLMTRNIVGATLREMANLTGVKYPTAHRLIKILEGQGRVRRDEKSRWHLVPT